ncbi:MAG: radical SAM protein [Tenericutes bacterium]|jgi:DNA repair photolyase|nr:radical SAM protein [Mycoplasmatota bacterium]
MHYKKYKHILLSNGTMNLTRGCVHGCIYCDSRSKCYQFEHAFTDVEIKEDAANMLDDELSRKRNKIMIKTGAMSDPYMNILEVLNQTRACFEVIYKHKFGLSFQTKSTMFLRDLDLLTKIHEDSRLVVQMTLTTYDDDLSRKLEPNVEKTSDRLKALNELNELGIPTIVWISPLLPWINDDLDNLKNLLLSCKNAGVKGIIWYGPGLTLREGNREYFYKKLDELFPGIKEKYQKYYGLKYDIQSQNKNIINNYFKSFCEENQIMYSQDEIYKYINEMNLSKVEQLSLF